MYESLNFMDMYVRSIQQNTYPRRYVLLLCFYYYHWVDF
jgi:hypothetical protein